MGPVVMSTVITYFIYLLITLLGTILGATKTIQYKQYADTSTQKMKHEKIYGIIGISLIVLFLLVFLVIPQILAA